MLFVTGMAYGDTHKHADELSFELFESGQTLLIDSGKYGYDSDPMRTYVLSAAAHNTISLLNKNIGPMAVNLRGSALTPIRINESDFEISGIIERPGLFTQRRTLLYRPGAYLIVSDRLTSGAPQEYVSSLHLAPEIVPDIRGRQATASLKQVGPLHLEVVDSDCRLEAVRGRTNPPLGWTSTGYMKVAPTTTLRAICLGANRSIAWIISFSPEGREQALQTVAARHPRQ